MEVVCLNNYLYHNMYQLCINKQTKVNFYQQSKSDIPMRTACRLVEKNAISFIEPIRNIVNSGILKKIWLDLEYID